MRSSHTGAATAAIFDDPNLVSHAGLEPVMRLAERVGLAELAGEWLKMPGSTGANAGAKISSIVAGMACGADSIDDLGVIRHGAMPLLFTGIRAPSTLGTFLRGLSWGDVSSVQAVVRRVLPRLAEQTPLLPEAEDVAFVDIDSKVTQVYGVRKQGAKYGYTKVRGLHWQMVTLSTRTAAPVILATRLRSGNADSARAADSLIAEALATARACGVTGTIVVRGDSRFYNAKFIAACRAAKARFSVTMPTHRTSAQTAIASISETAWRAIQYSRPIYDEVNDLWVSRAEVAETSYTAFTNPTQNRGRKTTARMVVRRVKVGHTSGVNPDTGQTELFPVYRYHAVFTDSHEPLLTAEAQHRDHALIEQVFADLNDSAAAHFPSGKFAANAAWLALAALTHNLLRAIGCLAGGPHTTARTGTLRRQLISVAARLSRTARTITLHLPCDWPWEPAWHRVFDHAHAPPAAT